MKNYSKLATALLSGMLLIGFPTPVAASDPAPGRCQRQLYSWPDGRLTPNLLGRMPKTTEPVVGFEIVHDKPLVALPRQLLGFTEKGINEMDVPQSIKGLSIVQSSRIELQTSSGFQTVVDTGIAPDKAMNSAVRGRLYGSGGQVFVEVRAHQNVLQFIARKPEGNPFPIATIKGSLRAASWNEQGLAAVVGTSLYVWQPGAKNVIHLLTDRGLEAAHDVVAVGKNRVIVGLKNAVVLVTPETITVVGALPSARCRFHNGTLYVLEESNGLMWSFRGLENLGTRQADQAFARELLKQAASLPGKSAAQFHEAARILGCTEAGGKTTRTIPSTSSK